MRNAALKRPAALLAALSIAATAIAAVFHHHGPLVLDAAPDRPALVALGDEGPATCGLCAGNAQAVPVALVPTPAPVPSAETSRPVEPPTDGVAIATSGTPRSPPVLAAFAV